MIKLIAGIAICVTITMGLYFIANFLNPKEEYNVSGWVKDTGMISHRGYGKTGATTIEYSFNGSTYDEVIDLYISGLTVGEKYEMLVNPASPDHFIVMKWCPVFTADEEVGSTSGKITRVFRFSFFGKSDSLKPNSAIEFTYTVGNQTIEREQILPLNYKDMYGSLKKGDTFDVAYDRNNVRRAVMKIRRNNK